MVFALVVEEYHEVFAFDSEFGSNASHGEVFWERPEDVGFGFFEIDAECIWCWIILSAPCYTQGEGERKCELCWMNATHAGWEVGSRSLLTGLR